jgi:hypothetical protein
MLNKTEKIRKLKDYLLVNNGSYADDFKSDILDFLSNHTDDDVLYNFLDELKNESDIKQWVNNVLSHIVMKFDEQFENISDFIYEFTIMNYRLCEKK